MSNPSIIISIPLVWGIRNTLNSGLIDLLANDFEIHVAVPPVGYQSMKTLGFPEEKILKLYIPKSDRISKIVLSSLKTAHRAQRATNSDQIFASWYKQNEKNKGVYRKVLVNGFSKIIENKNRFAWTEKYFQRRITKQVPTNLIDQVKKIKPVAALSTSYVSNWEWPLFNVLQNYKIPTASHVLSFDNLTSRGFIPMGRFNEYYAWQQKMSEELTFFFDIDPHRIKITGTPQFDFHILSSFHWDRQQTASKLGINSEKPYIAYCANHHKHTPGEPELITHLVHSLRNIERFKDAQWVIRIHPMDQYKRWESIFSSESNITISHPWSREDNLSYWAVPDNDEIALLGNTLRHAVATVTMASTVALDSCVVDTPVICIGFHPNKGSPEDIYYHKVHFTHHYEPIINSGAVSFVKNTDEFVVALMAAVDNPEEKKVYREKLKNQICGNVDGMSASRLADQLKRLACLSEN